MNTVLINSCIQLTEIKKESKNENLHTKKNKTNDMLKNRFQMKIIQCYKLAIDTIQVFVNVYTLVTCQNDTFTNFMFLDMLKKFRGRYCESYSE